MTKRELEKMNGLAFSIISTFLLLLSTSYQNELFALSLCAIFLIGLIKPEYLVPVYFVSSLSSNYFVAFPGVGYTRLLAIIIIGGTLHKLYRQRKRLESKWIISLTYVFAVSLLSILFSYSGEYSPLSIISLNILVFVAMANFSINEAELNNLLTAIWLATVVTTFYFTWFFYNDPSFLLDGRLTIEEGVNENRFAMMLVQLSGYNFAYMFFHKRSSVKVVCFALVLVNFYFLLLTGSRSAMVGLICGCLLAIFLTMYNYKKIKKLVFGMILFCIALIAIFATVIESNSTIMSRMNLDQVVSSGGTRRWPRIVAEVEYIIPKHLFLGVGLGSNNEAISLSSYMSDTGSSHNIVVSALAQVGFVGFFIYATFYFRVIGETLLQYRTKEAFIIPVVLIFTAVFNGIGEVMFTERLFWNALAIAALMLTTRFDKKRPLETSCT